jgi:hypothetical protein
MDSPTRRFVREGVLNVKRTREGKVKKLNVWLFNDQVRATDSSLRNHERASLPELIVTPYAVVAPPL